jgi:hypothetical protein
LQIIDGEILELEPKKSGKEQVHFLSFFVFLFFFFFFRLCTNSVFKNHLCYASSHVGVSASDFCRVYSKPVAEKGKIDTDVNLSSVSVAQDVSES